MRNVYEYSGKVAGGMANIVQLTLAPFKCLLSIDVETNGRVAIYSWML